MNLMEMKWMAQRRGAGFAFALLLLPGGAIAGEAVDTTLTMPADGLVWLRWIGVFVGAYGVKVVKELMIRIVTGTIIVVVAIQLLFGRNEPWIPRRALEFSFSRDTLLSAMERGRPPSSWTSSRARRGSWSAAWPCRGGAGSSHTRRARPTRPSPPP